MTQDNPPLVVPLDEARSRVDAARSNLRAALTCKDDDLELDLVAGAVVLLDGALAWLESA